MTLGVLERIVVGHEHEVGRRRGGAHLGPLGRGRVTAAPEHDGDASVRRREVPRGRERVHELGRVA